METVAENCALRAIAWLEGSTVDRIVSSFDEIHDGRDWFDERYGVLIEPMFVALSVRGWRCCTPDRLQFAIPPRALITFPSHSFAVDNGRIFDTAPGAAGGERTIRAIMIPPEVKL